MADGITTLVSALFSSTFTLSFPANRSTINPEKNSRHGREAHVQTVSDFSGYFQQENICLWGRKDCVQESDDSAGFFSVSDGRGAAGVAEGHGSLGSRDAQVGLRKI